MEKLDFVRNLQSLKGLLKSNEIISFIDQSPSSGAHDFRPLTPLMIEAKSNFDKIQSDDPKSHIINGMAGAPFFTEKFISDLINEIIGLQAQGKHVFFTKPNFVKFYTFHKVISETVELTSKTLFNAQIAKLSSDTVLIFHVISSPNGVTLERYAQILSVIDEIMKLVQEILKVDESSQRIVRLLDSGSGTNIAVETTIETVKHTFDLFKTVFEWITGRKFYREKLRNSAILDNIKVMTALKEAQDAKVIPEDRGKILNELLIRRTEELLDLQVLPKELVAIPEQSRQLLLEHSETKLLEKKE